MKKTQVSKAINVVVLILVIAIHLIVSGYDIYHYRLRNDQIFTYTLANTPYDYDYIDHMFKHFPQDNGWIDSTVLRQDYMVTEFNRFDFSQVYWHVRIDFHPLFYYSAIHFICSLFPNTFSKMYAGSINLFFLLIVDLLLIAISNKIWKNSLYAIPMITMVSLMTLFREAAVINLRPYTYLSACVLMYLYLHISATVDGAWSKKKLIALIFTILVGTQVHYYFYFFAGLVSFYEVLRLFACKQRYSVINYVFSGFTGIMLTMILFPWMLWATVINRVGAHDETRPWSVAKVIDYIHFMPRAVLNGRWAITLAVLVIVCILGYVMARRKSQTSLNENFSISAMWQYRGMLLFTLLTYSVIVFYFDETVETYMTPIYFLSSLFIMDVIIRSIKKTGIKEAVAVVLAFVLAVIIEGVSQYGCIKQEVAAYDDYHAWQQLAIDNSGRDAIYVYDNQDNLFNSNWMEVAQSKSYKVINPENYTEIDDSVLAGRYTDGEVLVYLPSYLEPKCADNMTMTKIGGYETVFCYRLTVNN